MEVYRKVIENLATSQEHDRNLAEQFYEANQRMKSSDPHRNEISDCWKILCVFLEPFPGIQRRFFLNPDFAVGYSLACHFHMFSEEL